MNDGNYDLESGGLERALDQLATTVGRGLRVAMPGRVVSFNAADQTIAVELMLAQLLSDGRAEAYPVLPSVPVFTLRGGKYCVTLPIAAGDPCLVIFGDRCIDTWFNSGSTVEPGDFRMHDLSDGFALVGPAPAPGAIAGFSNEAAALRSVDGDQYVRLDPDGSITNANGAGSTVLGANGSFTINAPGGITLNGNTLLRGDLGSEAGNGGTGSATLANTLRAVDIATPNVASHDRHQHSNPEGGNVGFPF